MDKVTVGIISDNRRLRVAYRLLLEQETKYDVEVVWDALLEEVKVCQKRYRKPDVLLVDYEGMRDRACFGLKELKSFFPKSCFLFVCDDANVDVNNVRNRRLNQFVTSKYCSARSLLAAISKSVSSAFSPKTRIRRGYI